MRDTIYKKGEEIKPSYYQTKQTKTKREERREREKEKIKIIYKLKIN